MAINKIRVVGDTLDEVGVLDKELPIKGEVTFGPIVLGRLVFEGLAVPDEEEVVGGLLHVQKNIFQVVQRRYIAYQIDSILQIIIRNRSMSVTISNCNQICNAPTNNSSAKMLYSFPKQSRFLKRKTIQCDKFYELKSTLSHRGAGFGYGSKYDFTRESPHSPPPNSYHFSDSFNNSPKKGFVFGESRQKMTVTGPLVGTIHNKNPGPGNYEAPHLRSKISYSLSGKIEHPNKQLINVPGPGQYPTTFSINRDGKYFHAKYKNSCVRDFGRVLGRCQTAANKLPGPGAYDVSSFQDISPKGKYCLSNSHNCLARSFGASQRGDLDMNRTTPGPGNYRIPSQFGYYTAKLHEQEPGEWDKENGGDKEGAAMGQGQPDVNKPM